MNKRTPSTNLVAVLSAIVLVLVNAGGITFYALWQIADTAAVNRAEQHGFDAAQLLPNAHLMWAAAHATLVGILLLDALAVIIVVNSRRVHTSGPRREHVPRSPAEV